MTREEQSRLRPKMRNARDGLCLRCFNGDNRRDVIATVFKGVDNRMKSGYLLRDVLNKVNGIHFSSSDWTQGCIRIRDQADIRWLWDNLTAGDGLIVED